MNTAVRTGSARSSSAASRLARGEGGYVVAFDDTHLIQAHSDAAWARSRAARARDQESLTPIQSQSACS